MRFRTANKPELSNPMSHSYLKIYLIYSVRNSCNRSSSSHDSKWANSPGENTGVKLFSVWGIFGYAENFPQPPDMPINGNTTQWATLEAAFINNQPHSKSVKRQDFQVQAEKLSKCAWHVKGVVSNVLPDPVLKHSRVNQSPGSWVPWGPAWGYLFVYFSLFVSLSGIIITLPLISPSFYPYCALLVVNFCFLYGEDGRTLSLVLGRLLWINRGVTSAFPAWVPFYSPRTCWAFTVRLHC